MTTKPNALPLPPIPDRWVKLGLSLVLAMLVAVMIVPAALTGQWPWVASPQVAQIKPLQMLLKQGLTLPGWVQTSHQVISLNQQDWSLGEYTAEPSLTPAIDRIALLLLPQPWHSNQPQVEWLDITGAQRWQIEARQRLTIADGAGVVAPFQARFFRGQSDHQTFAVLQWYAWPTGGHPSPSHWFWANQGSQLTTHTLTPWVAVSLLLPVEPLADISAYQPLVTELGVLIQQQLMAAVFSPPVTP
ncbi:MAG: cyanoexosortase B system-associated protein [Nodosilinea sp.]